MNQSMSNNADWKQRLVVELGRDKKKTVILAVLLVVALVAIGRLLTSGQPARVQAAVAVPPVVAAQPTSAAMTGEDLAVQEKSARRDAYMETFARKISRDLFQPNTDFFPPVQEVAPKATAKVEAADENIAELQRRGQVQAQARSLVLQSTILGTVPTAIINGKVLRSGEWVSGFEVMEITTHTCSVRKNGVTVVLEMAN